MAFVKPKFTRGKVTRAGDILAGRTNLAGVGGNEARDKLIEALRVLTNWRAAHNYPINTFQATLRHRLKRIDKSAIVAQRLKRMSSIILKLQRFTSMESARMQGIGGLRAIVGSIKKVRALESLYRQKGLFKHGLHSSKDYIAEPIGHI